MAIFNFKDVNEIPIEDVLAFHGIYPNSKGWYAIRPEDDTPSAHIDSKRRYGNTVHDFGETGEKSNTFNPLTLTMYLRNLDTEKREDWVEAARILGEAFGLQPMYADKDGSDKPRSDKLLDWEWNGLMIHPDMASKNMTFYPEKFGDARTDIYANNFRMSMSELREKAIAEAKTKEENKGASLMYLPVYERILKNRGYAYVAELKSFYYSSLYNWHNLRQELNLPIDMAELAKDDDICSALNNLITAEKLYKKAIAGTTLEYNLANYTVERDLQKVLEGKVGFEIGRHSRYEIQAAVKYEKEKVFRCLVSVDEYYKLVSNGLDNIQCAAWRKGDMVDLHFASSDSSRVNFLVRALRGKERNVSIALEHNSGMEQEQTEDVVMLTPEESKPEQSSSKEYLGIT